MKCPKCNSTSPRKNGHRRGKQCYQCRVCGRQ
ncbi:MAG: transposase-like zinc-binding domain-containing protein, partial [Waterburya sp.]